MTFSRLHDANDDNLNTLKQKQLRFSFFLKKEHQRNGAVMWINITLIY